MDVCSGIDFSGSEFIYSPEFQGSLSAFYERSLGARWGLNAAFNVRYQSESSSVFEHLPLYEIPGYAVVNGSIGLRSADDRWSVMLWGRNLLDDRYLNLIFDSPAQTGSISGYINQPRTYGVSARFRW